MHSRSSRSHNNEIEKVLVIGKTSYFLNQDEPNIKEEKVVVEVFDYRSIIFHF